MTGSVKIFGGSYQPMPIKITKKEHKHNYKSNKWSSFLGGVICLVFSLMGFWIVFYGDAENIQGGIPFIAETTNQIIGKLVFAFGALISGLISIMAFRELVESNSK